MFDIPFEISAELYQWLRQRAAQMEQSISETLEALLQWLKDNEELVLFVSENPEMIQRLLKINQQAMADAEKVELSPPDKGVK